MKCSSFFLIFGLFFAACGGNKNKRPDISGIDVEPKIERFDKAYFSQDSLHLEAGMTMLAEKYPYFINDFTNYILGAGVLSDTNKILPIANRKFFTSYLSVYRSLEKDFSDLSGTEKALKQAFGLLTYYFPNYQVPRFVSYLGPFDAPGVALTENAIAIGLQAYAGKGFPFYTSVQGQELYPAYISRRFEKSYITANCIKAVEDDLFPDKSQGLPLIEQMVEKGKYWWLADLLLPDTPDSIKTGFTADQLEWCKSNEGVVWNLLLQNDQLYTTDPGIVQLYIGDAPGTDGFPPAAPGNIGQWIGQKIVSAYVAKNPKTSPKDLMNLPARTILEGAKYKPR